MPGANSGAAIPGVVEDDGEEVLAILDEHVRALALEAEDLAVEGAIVMLTPRHAVARLLDRNVQVRVHARHRRHSDWVEPVVRR